MSDYGKQMDSCLSEEIVYKQIGDIAKVSIGEFVHKNNQNPNGAYPVYNGGTTPTGFYDEYNMEGPKIIMSARGANAGFVNRIMTNYWAGNSCYSIDLQDETVDWDYLYFILKRDEKSFIENQQTSSIPSVSKKQLETHVIPIPPLHIQREIVEQLSDFVNLIDKLNCELNLRKQQYTYYMQRKFSNADDNKIFQIGEICEITKGKTAIQKAEEGIYPLVVTTTERKSCSTYQFDKPSVCVPLVSSRGHGVASLNHVYYQEGKFALGNILCAITPKDENVIMAKYLYYYLEYMKDFLLVPLMKGGANVSMHISDIQTVQIPVPEKEEQRKVVECLNLFDKICCDERFGLPAEIHYRQTQYEFYRNVMLTFKGE